MSVSENDLARNRVISKHGMELHLALFILRNLDLFIADVQRAASVWASDELERLSIKVAIEALGAKE